MSRITNGKPPNGQIRQRAWSKFYCRFSGAKADKNGLPKYEDYYPMNWDKKQKKVPGTTKRRRIALDPTKADTAKKAQDEAIRAMIRQSGADLCSRADTYVGEEINGMRLTPSGLIAGYRLGGTGTIPIATAPASARSQSLPANGKEDGKER